MTNEFLPSRRTTSRGTASGRTTGRRTTGRRTAGRRARVPALIGAAVLALLLVWQLTARLGGDTRGDTEPVISGAGSTAGSAVRPGRPAKSSVRQYDETSPAGLVPDLRARLARATAAAADDGITVTITSARRSTAKQQELFDDAIVKYGSREAATRWVLPPADSAHVRGRAVDLGPRAAMRWMDEHGWRYGICRRYDNEPWHFEATTLPGHQCPPREPYAVATSD